MESIQHIEDFQITRLQHNLLASSLVSDDMELRTLSKSMQPPINKAPNTENTIPFEDETKIADQLKRVLEQRNEMISILEKKVEQFKIIMADNGIGESATKKIVELSQKNRDLHSELAKDKTRIRKLQNQLSKLLEENKTQQEKVMASTASPTQEQSLQDKVSGLEEKIVCARRKVAEQSNLCQKLKQDLKLAQKVLVQEVGEGVTISGLSKSNGWKGRAQQIVSLQNKIRELQHQVTPRKDSCISTVSKHQLLDDKHKARVHRIDKENKQRYQDLKGELDKLQTDHEALQQQCSALKARNKTLTLECKEMKKQVHIKQAIDNENPPLEPHVHDKLEKIVRDLQLKLRTSEEETRTLKERLSKREISETRLTSTRQNKFQGSPQLSSNGSITLPPIKHIGKTMRSSLSAEANPTIIQRKFLGIDSEELRTKYRVLEIERDRLFGLSELLQKRLDEADDKISRFQTDLNMTRSDTRGRDTAISGKGKVGMSTDLLQEGLVLQKDENTVLRDTLMMTRLQRQEDRRHFHSLMEETRQIFSETLAAFKNNKQTH